MGRQAVVLDRPCVAVHVSPYHLNGFLGRRPDLSSMLIEHISFCVLMRAWNEVWLADLLLCHQREFCFSASSLLGEVRYTSATPNESCWLELLDKDGTRPSRCFQVGFTLGRRSWFCDTLWGDANTKTSLTSKRLSIKSWCSWHICMKAESPSQDFQIARDA